MNSLYIMETKNNKYKKKIIKITYWKIFAKK